MRKVRQGVMANGSYRDPPSLHDVQEREACHGNEARIGKSHQGQWAQKPRKKVGYKTATCLAVTTNRPLPHRRRPYKCHILSCSPCAGRIFPYRFKHIAVRSPSPRPPEPTGFTRLRPVVWRCNTPIRRPGPRAGAQPQLSWQLQRSIPLSTGCSGIGSQGWVPAFAGTVKGGQRPAQPGRRAHRIQADTGCVHAVGPERGSRGPTPAVSARWRSRRMGSGSSPDRVRGGPLARRPGRSRFREGRRRGAFSMRRNPTPGRGTPGSVMRCHVLSCGGAAVGRGFAPVGAGVSGAVESAGEGGFRAAVLPFAPCRVFGRGQLADELPPADMAVDQAAEAPPIVTGPNRRSIFSSHARNSGVSWLPA